MTFVWVLQMFSRSYHFWKANGKFFCAGLDLGRLNLARHNISSSSFTSSAAVRVTWMHLNFVNASLFLSARTKITVVGVKTTWGRLSDAERGRKRPTCPLGGEMSDRNSSIHSQPATEMNSLSPWLNHYWSESKVKGFSHFYAVMEEKRWILFFFSIYP